MIIASPCSVLPSLRAVGGKARHLAALEAVRLPVPAWCCITTDAFDHALREAGLDERIRATLAAADADAVAKHAPQIQDWVRSVALPDAVRTALPGLCAQLDPSGDVGLAVRSSAVDEDAAGGSFAGLHDSFLFVRGVDAVAARVRDVWASAFNARALAYRVAQGLPLEHIAIAVVVQRMVDAHVSGVLFTANPASGSVHEQVISALYGAGEGLVSAGLDADTWVVAKDGDETRSETLAVKATRLVPDPDAGGLREESVPESLRDAACLSPAQRAELLRTGHAVEQHFRRPQDIEFCFDADGALHVLQARPVTTVAEDGPAAGHHLVWDNSNIIESYSGVTSPLTFSFIRRAYTIVYHCFAQVMGIAPRKVRANAVTFENMLGLIRGEVYYNLFNWYRLVRLFPGFAYNKAFMESMMGVKEPIELASERQDPGVFRRYAVELPALLRLLVRSVWNFTRIRGLVARFQARFDAHYGKWTAMDFDAMTPHELMAVYREMEQRLLWQWKAPIINDFFVMISYGTLRTLCARWCDDEAGTLQNDLLCGEGGIESTAPSRMLMDLARQIQADPALVARFRATPPEQLAAEIPTDPACAELAQAIAHYLDLYGFRCMNELKLEEPSLRDRPAFLYQVLRNYLALAPEALDTAAQAQREQALRRDAEARVRARLTGRIGWRWRVFFGVLRCARLGVKNRENMRFARTRIYGLLRDLFRAIGRQWHAAGLLDAPDDIFYLAVDEIWDFIKGTAICTDLRGLCAVRRAEFEAYRAAPEDSPDDRFDTYGMVYHRNRFRSAAPAAAAPEDGSLQGTGCCPGEVTGPVKVLLSPTDDMALNGEILVAGRTDPGWVPLYPSVSGLLIERGSILSHSAIVAREMGLPAIVGIPGLTTRLKTGDVVTMNGATGTVRQQE